MSNGNLNKIKKREDSHAIISSNNLKEIIEKKIKKVFANALKCIEIKFGDQFDGHKQMRCEILRAGNDAIREIKDILDSSFNVEEVPDVLTVRFVNKENGNEGKDNF